MATYKQGILGPFSGKVGTVVGSSWRGIAYIRSLAAKVANPRTAAQVAARAKLSEVASKLRPFANIIRAGFVNPGAMSPWSAAVKRNMSHAQLTQDGYQMDMDAMEISDGTANYTINATLSASSADFEWTAPEMTDDFYGARLYAGAYNVKNGKSTTTSADLTSTEISMSLTDIATGEADEIHLYYFVASSSLSTVTSHIKA